MLCRCHERKLVPEREPYKMPDLEPETRTEPESELGRLLTVEECDWLNARGFHNGYDTDVCDPQLNHIVVVFDAHCEKVEPICGATTLWFHSAGWNGPRGDGVTHDKDRRLRCAACVAKFDELFRQSETRTKRGLAWTLRQRGHSDTMEEIISDMRTMGRPDLALLLDSVRVAYMTDTEMSERTMRHMLVTLLTIKSDRILRAAELLRDSDGE